MGIVEFLAGTPVQPSQTLTFGYDLTFIGSATFEQELTYVAVPLPLAAMAGFAMLGGLAIVRKRRMA